MSNIKKFDRLKAFGQNFLIDEKISNKIVDSAWKYIVEKEVKNILEIGPGRGALTNLMKDKIKSSNSSSIKLTLSEVDRELIEYWKIKNEMEKAFDQVIEGDFLKSDLSGFESEGNLFVLSNLPYSSGTAILKKLCRMPKVIVGMVLMFQKEVAERISAEPSGEAWGSLSLVIQNEWSVKRLFDVHPGSFRPAPKIMSQVVSIVPRVEKRVKVEEKDQGVWEELLRRCFLHRRKTLLNNLGKSMQETLELAEIDPGLRAEALSWSQWGKLYEFYRIDLR